MLIKLKLIVNEENEKYYLKEISCMAHLEHVKNNNGNLKFLIISGKPSSPDIVVVNVIRERRRA